MNIPPGVHLPSPALLQLRTPSPNKSKIKYENCRIAEQRTEKEMGETTSAVHQKLSFFYLIWSLFYPFLFMVFTKECWYWFAFAF